MSMLKSTDTRIGTFFQKSARPKSFVRFHDICILLEFINRYRALITLFCVVILVPGIL
jgi:hypothetical protein